MTKSRSINMMNARRGEEETRIHSIMLNLKMKRINVIREKLISSNFSQIHESTNLCLIITERVFMEMLDLLDIWIKAKFIHFRRPNQNETIG